MPNSFVPFSVVTLRCAMPRLDERQRVRELGCVEVHRADRRIHLPERYVFFLARYPKSSDPLEQNIIVDHVVGHRLASTSLSEPKYLQPTPLNNRQTSREGDPFGGGLVNTP